MKFSFSYFLLLKICSDYQQLYMESTAEKPCIVTTPPIIITCHFLSVLQMFMYCSVKHCVPHVYMRINDIVTDCRTELFPQYFLVSHQMCFRGFYYIS